jgi:hypothetical protein
MRAAPATCSGRTGAGAGHINLIGACLCRRLLGRAVARARGEEPEPEWTPEINLGASAFIPQDYVPEPEVRLNLHARLARLASLDEVEAFAEELGGRFGPPPEAMDGLLVRVQAAIFCYELRITKVEAGPKGIAIAFRTGSAASPTGNPSVVAKKTEPGAERHAVVLDVLRKLKAGELRPRKRSRSRAGLPEERAMPADNRVSSILQIALCNMLKPHCRLWERPSEMGASAKPSRADADAPFPDTRARPIHGIPSSKDD